MFKNALVRCMKGMLISSGSQPTPANSSGESSKARIQGIRRGFER